jgi:hypothetical protein
VFLADDFGETLRTVLARQNLIAHGRETMIIRDALPVHDLRAPVRGLFCWPLLA